MRRLCAIVLSILLALGWLVGPAASADAVTPAKPSASPGHPVRGVAFSVTGKLPTKVARPVSLQRKSGSKWVTISTGRTTSSGRYSFSTTASASTAQLRVYAPKVKVGKKTYARLTSKVSTVKTVAVTPASPMAGETFTVVESLGKKGARSATLQRQSGKSWPGIATTKTTSAGTATFTASLSSSASLRVYAPKTKIKKKTYSKITVATFKVAISAQSGTWTLPNEGTVGQALIAQTQFSPARPGRVVELQQLVGSEWVSVASSTEDADGKATLGVAPSSADTITYRATARAYNGAPAVSTSTAQAVITSGVAEPSIVIGTLAPAVIGDDYHSSLTVAGGTAPYEWTATGLPEGMSLSADGVLSGAPTTPGTYDITIRLTDAHGKTAQTTTQIVVRPMVGIDTDSLPAGIAGQTYTTSLTGSGGTTPYHWSAEGLPTGLAISDDGVISGTTAVAGDYEVTLTITDDKTGSDTKKLTLSVGAALALTTENLPDGTNGAAYSTTLAATGGATPYTWSSAGLPSGLSLNAEAGTISGTPTEAGTFDAVTITVTDDNGYTAEHTFTIVIAAAFAITTTSLPHGVVGTTYADTTLATIAGTAPFTWSQTGLPDGLTLSTDGEITGTPSQAGTFDAVQISVTDSASHTAEATLSITVAPAVHITTTSLPNGVAGTAYTETTLTAADGNDDSYFWSADTLPDGLSLNGNTGTITGTPTTTGTTNVTITVTDAQGKTAEATFSITVAPAVHITTTSLPNGVAGTDYPETTLTAADGNSASYTWSSTTLPDGLSISTDGTITGTPTSAGVYDAVKITVTDAQGKTAEATFSITIAQAVHITTASLPNGVVGTAYAETTLAAADGSPDYTWTATGLPDGLGLTSAGVLSGIPTESGTFDAVKITVTDDSGKTATAEFSITVAPAVHITTTSLPNGVVGTAYTETTLVAADGTAGYTWTATGLPTGLSLDADTGVLSGTPTDAGTFAAVRLTVTDAAGKTAETTLSITVAPAVHITTTSLPSGVVGTDYSATLAAADGNDDFYFWTSDTLPAGLSLNGNTGALSGTPTDAGTFDAVKITVTDAAGKTAEATYTITITPAVHITTTSLPNGVVGTDYTATLTAADGTPDYTWASTTLPDGLTLSETGVLSGAPTTAGTFTDVKATVTDAAGKTVEATYTVAVTPAVHITTASLPDAVLAELYPATTMTAADGNGGYTWSATGLPEGVTLDADTGALGGTPAQSGTFDAVKVTVTDAQGKKASHTYTVTVHTVVAVTTTDLPDGVLTEEYSATLTGLGGSTPYTWAVTGLPQGLELDSATGAITGTPTESGSFDLDVTLTDDHAKVATTSLTLTVHPAVGITTASLPIGVVGTSYTATFTASGGTTPYRWTAMALPSTLTLSEAGVLTGTPDSAGIMDEISITVTDAHGKTATFWPTLTIVPAVHITTTSLPSAVVGTSYTATLTAADGNGAATWTSTDLPDGLSLAGDGTISGEPTTAGDTEVTFTATDPKSKTATWTTTISVTPAVHVTTTELPGGVVDTSYTATLTAADGNGAATWTSTGLPDGLTLSTDGEITGTPTASGDTEVTFTATDPKSKTATWTTTITVAPAVHITTTSLPSVEAGDAYPETTLNAADGTPGYTWTSTALPEGLALSSDGTLTGTPTTAGETTVTFTATDSNGKTATADLTISITAAVHLTNTSLSIGVIGGDYTSTLEVAGGTAPYTVSTTTLPTGLSLSDDTISGTPTTAALNTPVEVTVTDARNKTSVTAFTVTVVTPKTESAGTSHTCAITPSGGIECWGTNVLGQLGDGTTTDSNYPVPVTGLDAKAISVASGANHTCALLATGKVQCWGGNSLGQLGTGTTSSTATSTAQDVPDFDGVVSIAAGQYFTCATLDDGTAKCWGMGTQGQLGTGSSASASSPALVANLSGVMDVEAGNGHACALTTSGTVSCWGRNNVRQLGAGVAAATTTVNAPVAVPDVSGVAAVSTHLGSHTCAITSTGVVKCWGANGYGQLGTSIATSIADAITVAGLTDAVNVTAGGSHSCALTSTGSALCWGVNNYGQLGIGTTSNFSATPATVTFVNTATTLTAGASHTCARDTTGAVECWGSNSTGQLANGIAGSQRTPLTVASLNGLTSIALGTDFACGLTATGGVKCWGSNSVGQLGNGTTTSSADPVQVNGLTSGATALTASEQHACALLSSGEVQCWGQGTSGQLGNNTTANSSTPVTPQGLSSGAVSVATGVNFSCAALSDGTAKCWGTNSFGQLGDGTNVTSLVPEQVSSLSDATTITAGTFHACVTTTGGAVKCWGNNGDGQVGDGNSINRNTPTQVIGLTSGATAVSATDSSSCAIVNDGVQCWGSNNYGQLGDGSTSAHSEPAAVSGLTNVTRIVSGSNHVCTITTDGGLKCWGGNGYGQLGDGGRANSTTPIAVSGLSSGVSSVGTGVGSTCAALTDGTVKCWGNNGSGQLGFLSNYNPTPASVVGFNASALVASEISLASGVVGTAYSEVNLAATGGASPYTWTATGLPAGLSVSSAGVLSGTPTEAGTSEVTFTVTDVRGKTAQTTASITVTPAVHITTTELPSGVVGTAYSTTLAAADGTVGYTWSSDVTPAGLSLGTDGVLSGTPTAATPGTAMQVTVTDAKGKTATTTLTIVITPVIQGVAALGGGPWTGCVITGTGGVECWGRNDVSQLGNGTTTSSNVPVPVSGLSSGVQQVVGGASHGCALTEAGGVKCWGANSLGQLGDGTSDSSSVPVDVVGLTSGVTAISANVNHTCAITISGALKCWGSNSAGQLGDGTLTDRHTPVVVGGLPSRVTSVATGLASTCAVTVDNGVLCWGSNTKGQLGNNSFTDSTTPVPVDLSATAASIGAFGRNVCVLTTDGGVKCWGVNTYGQLGDGSQTDSSVPVDVTGLSSGVAQIAVGNNHVCALTTAGAMKCWGDNTYGELGTDNTTSSTAPVDVTGLASGVTAMDAGNNRTCALTTTGTLKCWGTNVYGQLGDGTNTQRVAPVNVFGYGPAPVQIATSGLPSGEAGIAYPATKINRAGGMAPYTWSATGLPAGLSINTYTGVLSGTPTETGTFNAMTITVTDSAEVTAQTTLSLTVLAGVHVTTSSLPTDMVMNTSYPATTLAAADGVAPYTWSATGLPAGLSLDAGTGTITGTPTAAGVYSVVATATDRDGYAASTTLPLSVFAVAGAASDLTSIDGGAAFTCAMTNVGGVQCWGYNSNGQLGNGTTTTSATPVDVTGLSSAVSALTVGTTHACAITSAGGVQCWGSNASGQLGNGSTTNNPTAVNVTGLSSGVTAITAGNNFSCALTTTGGVQCWGFNTYGQLGNTTNTSSTVPVAVDGLSSGVTAIAAGLRHACAITTTGDVKCWGYNSNGQLGNGTINDTNAPVSVIGLSTSVASITAGTYHSCAVSTTGALTCWGYNAVGQLGNGTTTDSPTPVDVTGLSSGVSSATAGGTHTCAITATGVQCWGGNGAGQLGTNDTNARSVPTAVVGLAAGAQVLGAGTNHSCVITDSHDVACWGLNTYGQLGNGQDTVESSPVSVTGLTSGNSNVASGYTHSCALTTAGGVQCWGNNSFGQLGNGTLSASSTPVSVAGLSSGITAVTGGVNHTCALTSTGGVKCWGSNSNGQLGNGTTTDSTIPVDVTGLAGVTAITAGGTHTCALTSTGGVKCWGNNFAGAVGDGSTTDRYSPVAVSGLTTGVTAISAGGSHTCALTSTGGIKCWGYNEAGELGNGTTTSATAPVDVSGLTSGVTGIDAGGSETCAVTSTGAAKCWGNNSSGQLGNGTVTTGASSPVDVTTLSTGVTAIDVGGYHACARTTAGGLKCWGQNSYGQLGNGSTGNATTPVDVAGLTSDVANVSAGNYHACAVTSGGAVTCWGSNAAVQLGNGASNPLIPGAVSGHSFTAPVRVTTIALPHGLVGSGYSATASAAGGTGPYTWTASTLPNGLTLDAASGVISGTPTAIGTTSVTVTATDSKGVAASSTIALTVAEAPVTVTITTTALDSAVKNNLYHPASPLAATGGTAPYTWTATNLPTGITMTTAGLFSGTPTVAGTWQTVFTATDSAGHSGSKTLTMTVINSGAPS